MVVTIMSSHTHAMRKQQLSEYLQGRTFQIVTQLQNPIVFSQIQELHTQIDFPTPQKLNTHTYLSVLLFVYHACKERR